MIAYFALIAIQVLCIVDVVRNRANQLWIMALVFLPVASAIAYLIVEVLPRFQHNRHLRAATADLTARLDPERDLRAARAALDLADTVANREALGDALAALGRDGDAVSHYREALARLTMPDPRIDAKLARSLFESGDSLGARAVIDAIPLPATTAERDRLLLLKARILAELGEREAAVDLYSDIVTRLPGEEARCRFAALLIEMGDRSRARAVLEEVAARMKRLDRTQRAADAAMYRWAAEQLQALRA